MDPIKVQGVADWPVPHNVTDVRSFWGSPISIDVLFRNFSEVAKPLNALLQKDAKWEWTNVQFKAFEHLKTLLCSKPILVFPSDDRAFSSKQIVRVMLQEQFFRKCVMTTNGILLCISAKVFSPAKRNYDIYDKEMLAVIRALEQWRHYLEGAKHPVQILTDHKNLEYFYDRPKLNRRQARWSLFLSHFDITMTHRPGKSSAKPDILSRCSDS